MNLCCRPGPSAGKDHARNDDDEDAMVTEVTGSFNAGETFLEDIGRFATPLPLAPIHPPTIFVRLEPDPFMTTR